MKKVLFFLAAMLMIPMVHAAPEFKEGVNYDVVTQTGSAQPEVLEFFSYYCPHCAKFEPIAADLKKNLPEGVPMKKNPVAFLGREMGPEMQRAYAVANLLNLHVMMGLAAWAGLLLIAMALYISRLWFGLTLLEKVGQGLWQRLQPLSKALLPLDSANKAYRYGLLWGFLPCGLVYSSLSWSLASGSAWR